MNKVSIASCFVLLVVMTGLAGCSATGGHAADEGASASVAQIKSKLAADKSLADSKITVTIKDGAVVLEGTVKNQAAKDAAENIVYQVQSDNKQKPSVQDNLMFQ